MVQAHTKDDQGWGGTVSDENGDESLVSGTIGCREQDKKTPAARHSLFRGPGPDQQAHQQPEIVPDDMDQVALMHEAGGDRTKSEPTTSDARRDAATTTHSPA